MKRAHLVPIALLDDFDEVIDVRSPSEYAIDHVPSAISCPVLDDDERARVGTLYKQVSPFEAKKLGAVLVARNIARHVESRFADRPRDWRPLIYCWRGGKRSGAMAHILREIGWEAASLDGGYKAYRRDVAARLESLPRDFNFLVVCGETGSGKSKLLETLAARGAQVLDLERLACHRGSVLGDLPGEPQPAQKMFDSLLWDTLRRFDPARPVFVEAESRKIGQIQVPASLLERMREGRCLRLEVPVAERVRFLNAEYGHFLDNPEKLKEKLLCLNGLHGRDIIDRWIAMADQRAWSALVTDLLVNHYDPAYRRSTLRNYPDLDSALAVRLPLLSPAELETAAINLIEQATRDHAPA